MPTRLPAAVLLALALSWGKWAVSSPPAAGPVSSSAIAVSPDGAWVAVVNPDSDSITVLRTSSLKVLREVPVGDDPRSLCFSRDSRTIAVANRGSGDVSIVGLPGLKELRRIPTGAMPYGVVMGEDLLFVSEFAAGSIAMIDVAAGTVAARVVTQAYPAGLALSADRKSLLVTHFFSGRLSIVDLEAFAVRGVVEAGPAANLSQSVAISPDGRRAYLPQTLSNTDVQARTFDRTISPVVNVVDPASRTLVGRERVYMATVRRSVNRPSAAAVSPDGRRLYAANAGSDDILVAELPSGRILGHVDVGAGPEGLALSPAGDRLYVNNALDGTMSVVRIKTRLRAGAFTDLSFHRPVRAGKGVMNPDSPKAVDLRRPMTCWSCHTADGRGSADPVRLDPDGRLELVERPWEVEATVPLTNIPLPPLLLEGKRLFNSAVSAELTTDRWISCASCHPDGGMDARTWRNLPDGPRNTPALFGAAESLPIHWSGDLDELHDVELTIRNVQFGGGLAPGDAREALGAPYAGSSAKLDALAAYVASLRSAPSPLPADKKEVSRGAVVFKAFGCRTCHAPPVYSDGRLHAVGTGDPSREKNARGMRFDTPSLRGLWLTAPYFHDGTARTLEDVLRTGPEHDVSGRLSAQELRQLVAFLRSL